VELLPRGGSAGGPGIRESRLSETLTVRTASVRVR
jgi:hypothetical protein